HTVIHHIDNINIHLTNIQYKTVHVHPTINTTTTQANNTSQNNNLIQQIQHQHRLKLAMSTAPSKPIVKSLPQFNPTYYLAWSSDVRDAFEDRGWTSYLIAPATSPPNTTSATVTSTTSAFTPDPAIVNKARAFLK